MTKDEILAMKPGRELDKLIGCIIGATPSIEYWAMNKDESGVFIGFNYHDEAKRWLNDVLAHMTPNSVYRGVHLVRKEIYLRYSEDISAAWEVVEKMHNTPCKDGDHFVSRVEGYKGAHITAFLHHLAGSPVDNGLEYFEARAETAPLSICLAALLAKEVTT